MGHCWKHKLFFRYGECPECLRSRVNAEPYAAAQRVKARWQILSTHPELLNQDAFGICGMASAVYILLCQARDKADNLFQATYADVIPEFQGKEFAAASHTSIAIDYTYLVRRWALQENAEAGIGNLTPSEKKYIDKRPRKLTNQDQKDAHHLHFTDYCVSRALGYVLKKVAKSRYDQEKLQFAPLFNKTVQPGDYRQVTRALSLPLRTNNLAFIMAEILGAQGVTIASRAVKQDVDLAPPVNGVASKPYSTFSELSDEFAKGLDDKSFALAAIWADLIQDKKPGHKPLHLQDPAAQVSGPHVVPLGQHLAYNHWVVIKNFNRGRHVNPRAQPYVDLRVWTWGKYWDLRVDENDLPSYVQDVIFGHF